MKKRVKKIRVQANRRICSRRELQTTHPPSQLPPRSGQQYNGESLVVYNFKMFSLVNFLCSLGEESVEKKNTLAYIDEDIGYIQI